MILTNINFDKPYSLITLLNIYCEKIMFYALKIFNVGFPIESS